MADQVDSFINKANAALADAPPLPQDQPKVPFQTQLKLTADQEKRLIEHAFTRMESISNELGRMQTLNPTWWASSQPARVAGNVALASQGLAIIGDTFLGKRSRYDAVYYNDVSWRPYTMGPDNIFWTSNLTVPLSRRICRQMQARAKNSFFSTDPWFSVDPAPVPSSDVDKELADEVERFCRFKLHESNSKADKTRAIDRALILGECPVKTNYVVRDQFFDVEAMVLTDIDGNPVKASDGNTISKDDQWSDAEDGTGKKVLARDGQTPMPDAPIWQNVPLNKRQVLFEGARSEPIYYKDFLCPLNAPDVQQADCIVHLYDKQVIEFVDLVVKRGMVDDSTEARLAATQKMVALIQTLADNTNTPKAAMAMELRPNENFAPLGQVAGGGPIAEFAEFYLWYDANEDGVAENIMLIADRKNRVPVFYDHVANVTTDGLRPIEIVRINPVEGRWYGMGVIELFESYQTVIDLLVNRWNFSQSRAGRVDFWDPTATLEGDRDPSLKMNWGATYSLKPGKKPEDALGVVYLNDVKFEKIQEMMRFFEQHAMNESGVMNANDGQAAGLKSTDLATGIIQIEKSGDELFMPIMQDLTGPMTNLLNREIDVTLANMNPEEAYTYLEGDTMQIGKLTPEAVRGLRFKVKVDMTTHRNQQQLQLSAQAAALVEKFYSLAPAVQARVAQFYRDQLKALSPKTNADQVIIPMQPEEMAPPAGAAPVNGTPQANGHKPPTAAAAGPGNRNGAGEAPNLAPTHSTQLGQKRTQMPGVSAPGGTPSRS